MRLNDALHIGAFGNVADVDATVHDDVMKAEIDRPIGRDSASNPSIMGTITKADAIPEEADRRDGKNRGVKIIQFKCSVARLMVAFV